MAPQPFDASRMDPNAPVVVVDGNGPPEGLENYQGRVTMVGGGRNEQRRDDRGGINAGAHLHPEWKEQPHNMDVSYVAPPPAPRPVDPAPYVRQADRDAAERRSRACGRRAGSVSAAAPRLVF